LISKRGAEGGLDGPCLCPKPIAADLQMPLRQFPRLPPRFHLALILLRTPTAVGGAGAADSEMPRVLLQSRPPRHHHALILPLRTLTGRLPPVAAADADAPAAEATGWLALAGPRAGPPAVAPAAVPAGRSIAAGTAAARQRKCNLRCETLGNRALQGTSAERWCVHACVRRTR